MPVDGGNHAGAVFMLFPRLKERRKQAGGTLSGGEQEKRHGSTHCERQNRVTLLDEDVDPLEQEQPGLAALYGASVCGRIATGPNAGQRVKTSGDSVDGDPVESAGTRCAMVSGFSVHAGVSVRAGDRVKLERLIRYMARPPLANERLSRLPDGRLTYRLKTPWRNGTAHVVFEPLEFLEKLASLVPAPRAHLVRYLGMLAPAAKWRSSIVPSAPEADETNPECGHARNGQSEKHCRPRNYSWAELMRRVWSVDVLECPRCSGRMRIIAAIHPPTATRKILDCLGLPTRAPPVKPAVAEDIPEYL